MITGSFTFDTATNTESSVSMTLSGNAPFAETYSQATPLGLPMNNTVVAFDVSDNAIQITFNDPLDTTPDPITNVAYISNVLEENGIDTTGSAVFAPAAMPEPSTLPLLGVVIGLFLLIPRALRVARPT